jgi:hypothetical protein
MRTLVNLSQDVKLLASDSAKFQSTNRVVRISA